jgi:hypothetical protein
MYNTTRLMGVHTHNFELDSIFILLPLYIITLAFSNLCAACKSPNLSIKLLIAFYNPGTVNACINHVLSFFLSII